MSFPIPEPYAWDETFRVFYEQLDEEHKGLFKAIFDLAKDNTAANLTTLKDKVDAHFSYEEGKMKAASYAEFGAHKPLHEKFVGQLNALKAPVSADELLFAQSWLVNHIKQTDFKYLGKL